MAHYVCKGEKCKSVSDRPTICLDSSCQYRYKLLDECNCRNKNNHGKNIISGTHHLINNVNMGISVGLVVGSYLFLLGLAATYLGWGGALVENFSDIYVGYNSSLLGSISGGLWGFVDGFVFGVIIAWVYNLLHTIRR